MKKVFLILSIFLIFIFIFPINVEARTLQDLYNELDELKEKKDTRG